MILLKNVPADVSPFAVLTMNNGIGAALIALAFFKRIFRNIHKKDFVHAAVLAAMNVTYNSLMIVALRFMDSAAGSFIISFTLAIIPVMLIVMGRNVTKSNLAGMALITLGIIAALKVGFDDMDIRGPLIMLAVCLIRAFYIIKMNDFAKTSDAAVLSVLIGAMVTVLAFAIWFVMQPGTFFALSYSKEMLSSVFMDGYLICGYAVFVNLAAQKYASTTTCSAIYSFQIIFAVILAAVVPETLGTTVPITFAKAAGCVLIVAGTLCSELDFLKSDKGEKNA